jgi:hypothetical protein
MTLYDDDFDFAVDRIREAAEPRDERLAIAGRKLEFRSGPQNYTFYACAVHRTLLDTGEVDNFFALPRNPTFVVDPADGIECDFCREP